MIVMRSNDNKFVFQLSIGSFKHTDYIISI